MLNHRKINSCPFSNLNTRNSKVTAFFFFFEKYCLHDTVITDGPWNLTESWAGHSELLGAGALSPWPSHIPLPASDICHWCVSHCPGLLLRILATVSQVTDRRDDSPRSSGPEKGRQSKALRPCLPCGLVPPFLNYSPQLEEGAGQG